MLLIAMHKEVGTMTAQVQYLPLPTSEYGGTKQRTGKFECPAISRIKLTGFLFVILVAAGLVMFACFGTKYCTNSTKCQLLDNQNFHNSGQTESGDSVIPHHMKRRLPQCLIIGARKAGTRALLTYLDIHPHVVVKGPEMHFFDMDDNYHQSLDWYRKQMPYSYEDVITVEKTPAYFVEPDVPERVYRMNQTIKLFLILRDPVERTISDYLQLAEGKKSKNKPVASFEEHVLDPDGNINRSYKTVKRSIYHKHLSRWLEFFPLNQIFIIDSQELIDNPAGVMFQVEDFLHLEHKIKPSNFYFNKTKGFFCVKTEDLEKCLADSKGREHPEVDEVVLQKLRRFFAPHNQKLFHMIGRSFDWEED